MSDYQALLKELETVLTHTAAAHYSIASSLCLFVYDFLLTFPTEVEYFWGTPWSFVKAMFFWPGLNTRKVELGTSAAYVQAIPFLRDPLALCTGTIPKFLIFYPVPMMGFDTILLILVVYKAYLIQLDEASITSDKRWTGIRVMRIMFRDSVIYFACTVGVNLFNLLLWVVGPFDLFTLGTAWAVTVPVMAASHVLFNMRSAYHDPPSSTLNLEVDTEFQVAQRPHGASGPTVWSSSSEHTESSGDRI
ncbi:hypothetical protein B0H14DRAFT_3856091 [Mycena olivaceomarginata]|nr:hypothetical protein B0H14DRAFT_3856091 [Mycena olivaceomarginata]